MVSSENILNITTTKQAAAAVSSRGLENNQNNPAAAGNNHRKTARQQPQQDHQEQQPQALKCPRCDSPNTKFCYYNNYSLTQPRHFCKTCRRYWTKGGALRNVPIGGGCRKNKKLKSSSNSRLSDSSRDSGCSSSNDIGGFKFFHGLSPAMDFQLGGLSFPRLNIIDTNNNPSPFYSLFGSTGDAASSNPASSFSQLDFPSSGFNYHQLPCVAATNNTFSTGAIQEPSAGSLIANHDSLASSIESLSSINQDLHWRLQQQRLAMLFGGGGEDNNNNNNNNNNKDSPINNNTSLASAQKPQPILFQNLEISSPSSSKDHQEASLLSGVGNNSRNREGASCAGGMATAATEWFFGNSYAAPAPVTAACTTPTIISNNDNTTIGNWNANGVQAWSDLHRCSTLP